jgi:hypothetical protein
LRKSRCQRRIKGVTTLFKDLGPNFGSTRLRTYDNAFHVVSSIYLDQVSLLA